MYTMRSWWFTSFWSACLIMTICSYGRFESHWSSREKKYNRALIYIKTDHCTDARLRAKLGDFSKCEECEEILRMTPFKAAFYDIMEDVNICGHGRCTILYMDITKNFFRFSMGFLALCVVGLWTGLVDMKQMWDRKVQDHFTLPIKKKS